MPQLSDLSAFEAGRDPPHSSMSDGLERCGVRAPGARHWEKTCSKCVERFASGVAPHVPVHERDHKLLCPSQFGQYSAATVKLVKKLRPWHPGHLSQTALAS